VALSLSSIFALSTSTIATDAERSRGVVAISGTFSQTLLTCWYQAFDLGQKVTAENANAILVGGQDLFDRAVCRLGIDAESYRRTAPA
jgi:hypothetical protein